jgi:cytochrome c biogenesis protein
MSTPSPTERNVTSAPSRLVEFLGTMNLAITLLVTLAVASVIGTVLQQNQPYTDYLLKFGPFWFDVFSGLGLYDVYSAGWFVFILAFLVSSTSICLWRNAPKMLRDMWHFREHVQHKSLRTFQHKLEWDAMVSVQQASEVARKVLDANKYRARVSEHANHTLLASMRGSTGRLGYVFTHSAIVIILIGGLVDGNSALKFAAQYGDLKIETRDIPASQVPEESRLSREHGSFRASVTIPEGRQANLAFVRLGEGYLVQELPFIVEVEDFRVEHYVSGQPKSFESDLIISDPVSKTSERHTISVNHPAVYNGYHIYQSSFGDGGSKLTMRAWPLEGFPVEPVVVNGAVNSDVELPMTSGVMTMEISDFRLFNVNPVQEGDTSGKKFENYGPNFIFKMRDETGQAVEYENYQIPVLRDGRRFFLSGVRETVGEPFRYLHIPADHNFSINRFMKYLQNLHDRDKVTLAARTAITDVMSVSGTMNPAKQDEIVQGMSRMLTQFVEGGFNQAFSHLENTVPEDQREQVQTVYVSVLRHILGLLYRQTVLEEGGDAERELSDDEYQFFEDAVTALESLPFYGAPVFMQLESFEHVQATGLQIARAPGKAVVYLGCILLIIGVFLMFYMPHRRAWVWIEPNPENPQRTRLLIAGTSARHTFEYASEFEQMAATLKQRLSDPTDTKAD